MPPDWEPHETGTHQDHVIAHVVGATVLGYFGYDQSAHLALDIGFIWTIYADGEMGLVPQKMAVGELEADAATKADLRADLEALEEGGPSAAGLRRMTAAPAGCLITDVGFYSRGETRRLLVTGEGASLEVVTSLLTGDVGVAPAPGVEG